MSSTYHNYESTLIENTYNAVVALSDSLLTLTETGGTVTTDGTEQNVYINNAPSGVYTPKIFKIDFTNQTAGETVVLRVYYRIKSGGDLIKQTLDATYTYAGVQDPLLVNLDLEDNRYGVKVTIEKTGGANKAYDWEVVYKS